MVNKLQLVRETLSDSANYLEFITNHELTKEEKDILLHAYMNLKKETEQQNRDVAINAYNIIVSKSSDYKKHFLQTSEPNQSKKVSNISRFKIISYSLKQLIIVSIILAISLIILYIYQTDSVIDNEEKDKVALQEAKKKYISRITKKEKNVAVTTNKEAIQGCIDNGLVWRFARDSNNVVCTKYKIKKVTGFDVNNADCYEVGLAYGACATKAMQGKSCELGMDFVIPFRCRNLPETLSGIKTAVAIQN